MDTPAIAQRLREKVIAQPDVILDDRDMMRALVSAADRAMGDNVIDMRGLAMERLEARLDRLEDTHSTVLAAAYENLAGMSQVHRAILKMLEAPDFAAFLHDMTGEVSDILRIDCLRVVLESRDGAQNDAVSRMGPVLHVATPGFVETYIEGSRGAHRPVVLRAIAPGDATVYGRDDLRSEALMRLDFGTGRMPGMLAFASLDEAQFQPAQATDLLTFFAGVFERAMRRWLD